MTSVLVTGGSGFLGLPTLGSLVEAGADVHAVSTRPTPPPVAGVHWHRADLGDRAAVSALLAEVAPERLVHLAWYVEHGRFWSAPQNLPWVENSLHLIRAFAEAGGTRAVMLGSCAEYDWTTASEPLLESTSPIAPATLYGVAKDALRRLAGAYCAEVGVNLGWGRLFFLYGPREAPGRLVPSVINSLLAGKPAAATSGAQRRDFMHVADVARAIAMLASSEVDGAINIASGQAVPIAEILECIGAEAGRPELIRRGALPDRPGEPPLLAADVTRLAAEVGFTPRIDLAGGIADTIAWWRELAGSSAGSPAAG